MNLLIASHVDDAVRSHLREQVNRELGGFLLGRATCDKGRSTTTILSAFPCRNAPGSLDYLTFTPDCWQELHAALGSDDSEQQVVGWYHSHPDMPTSMSDRDKWLHKHFFGEPYCVAWIHDPVGNVSSYWRWQDGPIAAEPTIREVACIDI